MKKILIYAGSVDGFKGTDFHRCCDNKGPTLTIIKATSKRIFGGYTSVNWDSTTSGYKSDSNAYLFSVDNDSKHVVTDASRAIVCNSSYGPIFGSGNDICIHNNSNTRTDNYSSPNAYSSINNGSGKSVLTNNSDGYFQVEEIEVY